MRSDRRTTLPILILVLLSTVAGIVLAGCDNQSQPTAADVAAHDAKKKDANK